MNYEERYKQALETARKINSGEGVAAPSDWTVCEIIFPELRESEDEKIRKEIIKLVHFFYGSSSVYKHHVSEDDMIAWLEKQCKKTIPKSIDDAALQYVDTCAVDGRVTHDNINEPYWNNHSMMAAYKAGWLEKQGDTNETINRDKFAQDVLKGAAINLITWIDYNVAKGNMCLSNMECKDIEDALVSGDWDKIYAYMKKKLEKQGEQKHTPKYKIGDCIKYRGEEYKITNITVTANNFYYNVSLIKEPSDWGEVVAAIGMAAEEKMFKIEQTSAWNEEDEKMYNMFRSMAHGTYVVQTQETIDSLLSWLKSLKDRVQPQPKQEWSKEDEDIKETIIGELELVKKSVGEINYKGYDELINWLKSLKPQNNWKPSEEQMKSLKYFIDFHRPQANASTEGWSEFKHLESLIDDLEKLRLC